MTPIVRCVTFLKSVKAFALLLSCWFIGSLVLILGFSFLILKQRHILTLCYFLREFGWQSSWFYLRRARTRVTHFMISLGWWCSIWYPERRFSLLGSSVFIATQHDKLPCHSVGKKLPIILLSLLVWRTPFFERGCGWNLVPRTVWILR